MAKGLGFVMSEDKKWRAECDMRTLREAEQIMADSKRVAAAKAEAARQIKDLQKVTSKTRSTRSPRSK
jgi:hypothetical protein